MHLQPVDEALQVGLGGAANAVALVEEQQGGGAGPAWQGLLPQHADHPEHPGIRLLYLHTMLSSKPPEVGFMVGYITL